MFVVNNNMQETKEFPEWNDEARAYIRCHYEGNFNMCVYTRPLPEGCAGDELFSFIARVGEGVTRIYRRHNLRGECAVSSRLFTDCGEAMDTFLEGVNSLWNYWLEFQAERADHV